ncbi:MAG: serine protease [Bryobacteraceae bacterium]|nr:serine protease [Bryobacteraceae bacterium]
MTSTLASLSDDLVKAVETASRFVVSIGARPRGASGSYWRDGAIITVEHALKHDETASVTLPSGAVLKATVAGRDPGTDIAVLQLPAGTSPAELKALTHGSPEFAPDTVFKPGSLVLAVGRSGEIGINATMGVISAVGGSWRTWRGGMIDRFVRLDASLYPGSSGSAVVDPAGRLLGLATRGLSRVSGVAVPMSTVTRVAEELLSKGRVSRGYLGVGLQPVALPEHLVKQSGLSQGRAMVVLSVEPESPAGKAGVLLGDVLALLGGEPTTDIDDVQAALEKATIGEAISATILRGGERRDIGITVGERPRRGD